MHGYSPMIMRRGVYITPNNADTFPCELQGGTLSHGRGRPVVIHKARRLLAESECFHKAPPENIPSSHPGEGGGH